MSISRTGFLSTRKNYRAFLLALVVTAAASLVHVHSAGATNSSGFSSLSDATPFSGLPSNSNTPVTIFTMNATADSVAFNGSATFAGSVGIGSSVGIGIGSTAPQALLDIYSGTNDGVRVVTKNGSPYGLVINNAKYGSTDATAFGLWQNNNGSANIDVANGTRLSITSGGYVGINNMAPQYPLDVNGEVRASAYYHNSDARLKMDIRPIDNALDKVMALHGVTFTWKQDGRPDMGVVAQDVAKVFPDIVSRGTDGQGMMAVEYDSLAGPMIESIRELKMENDAMKAELVTIKATLKAMQDKDARLHDAAADFPDRAVHPSSTVEP